MKGTVLKIAIVLLGLGLLSYRVWSVGTGSDLWRAGHVWTVRVERVQAFVAEAVPPWAESNRVHFQVLGTTQTLTGSRIGVRVTFERPVLNGYRELELAYDGRRLVPVSGRLSGPGLADVDWATARPLLEASLFPFDGLSWRRAAGERLPYQAAGQELAAYRVVGDGQEYGWAEEAPWWLWYRAGDQVRAELVECSCWQGRAEALPPVQPVAETPVGAVTPQPAQAFPYDLVLKARSGDAWTVVAQKTGELVLERGLGTGVLTLTWGDPAQSMHIYVSIAPGATPQVKLDKVIAGQPASVSLPEGVSAPLVDGRATLEMQVMVGKALHQIVLTLRR